MRKILSLTTAAFLAATAGSIGIAETPRTQTEARAVFTDAAGNVTKTLSPELSREYKAARMGLVRTNTSGGERKRGPGWTNAHAKRLARKTRNVRRHRASSRG